MRFFFFYFKQRRAGTGVFILFSIIFICVFALYHLPVEAVLYPAGICATLGTGYLLFDFQKALRKPKMLIVGAHYDTKVGMDNWHDHGPARPSRTGTPGANDNASGVAALLETARALAATSTLHDVCLVAYANEEPPFYQTPAMGSAVHAKSVSHHSGREKIIGMIALETLGCYSPRVNKKRQSAVVAGLAGLPDRCD